MKILDLPLKAKWYNMIESGEKPEEYRDIKPYWMKRLLVGVQPWFQQKVDDDCASFYCDYVYLLLENFTRGFFIAKPYTHIRFRYGYTKRTMIFALNGIRIGRGKPEWGAPKDKDVFILKLGNKYESRRIND